jgi:hypothetical protein
MRTSPSIVPRDDDQDVYFVMDDLGRLGRKRSGGLGWRALGITGGKIFLLSTRQVRPGTINDRRGYIHVPVFPGTSVFFMERFSVGGLPASR